MHIIISGVHYATVHLFLFSQLVELISSDLAASDNPPYYSFTSPQGTRRFERSSGNITSMADAISLPEGMEGAGWAVSWRLLCHKCEGNPVPLPLPKAKQFFASFREMFKSPARSQQQQHHQQQQAPFHR